MRLWDLPTVTLLATTDGVLQEHARNVSQPQMRILMPLVIVMMSICPMAAQERPLTIEKDAPRSMRFGIPARFDSGILQYPGFTVSFGQKTELFRAGQPSWVIRTFRVLKDGHLTIGGDIVFNSEMRVNGRRFDVGGQIYVAELYYSTAGLKEGEAVSLNARLADDEIVIWDEATARSGNIRLLKIWQNEKVEPNARYFPQHVYMGGEIVPDFAWAPGRPNDGRSQLKPDSLEIEQVRVLADDLGSSSEGKMGRYGRRNDIYSGPIKYPDLTVVLVSRTENHLSRPSPSTRYEFKAYAGSAPGVRFSFDTYGLVNGCRFTVNGTDYFAEMFSTTAVDSLNTRDQRTSIPLKSDQLIVWDLSTARLKNPRIVPVLEDKSPHQFLGYFAGGAPVGNGFTGTYLTFKDWSSYAELDSPLAVLKDAPIAYPIQFAGSGYVGHVHGYLTVEEDGTVKDAIATHGSDNSFQGPSAEAIRSMRFTPPKRGVKPTKTRLNFSWAIAEPDGDTTSVQFE